MNVKKKPTIKEISRAILELNSRTNTLHTMLLDLEKAFSLYVDMEKKNEKFSKYIDKKVKEWKKENDAKANGKADGQDISAGTAASNLSGWSTSSNWIFHFATVTASNNSARSNIVFNFGQDGTFIGTQSAGGNSDGNGIGNFKHSVPSGYLALCTSNLGS